MIVIGPATRRVKRILGSPDDGSSDRRSSPAVRIVTSSAPSISASVRATARAARVYPFQAIATRAPKASGAVSVGGHIITGRPV